MRKADLNIVSGKHGGPYLVRCGPVEILKASNDGRRLVIFEFPAMEVIRSVWN